MAAAVGAIVIGWAAPDAALAAAPGDPNARSIARASTPTPAFEPLPAASVNPDGDIASLRTRTSRTYAAKHNSYEVQFSQQSVNYRDDLGRWQPIDNRIEFAGPVVRNRANRYAFTAPRQLGSGAAPIRVETEASWVEFVPLEASGEARINGASVTFDDAWPGVDLRYIATGDTVREEMILSSRAAVRDFDFDIELPSGTIAQGTDEGAIVVRDGRGVEQLRLSAAWMVDAAGERWPVASGVVRTSRGWQMNVTPDRGWLAASERKWPVRIDPTVTIDGVLGCAIVYNEQVSEASYCGEDLVVGEGCVDLCKLYRSMVRFDLANALPAGSVVEAATLSGVDGVDSIERITKAWNSSVDWDTTDGSTPWSAHSSWPSGGAIGDVAGISDVTALVREWVAGTTPNHGILFRRYFSPGNFDTATIDPVLSIQYAATDDPDGLQARAAGWYAGFLGITVQEALRRLRIQDRVNNLSDDIEAAIDPDDFAGIWIDDADDGRPKIGIEHATTPPQSKIGDAEELLEDHSLEDEVDFVAVPSSLEDLDDALETIADDLTNLLMVDEVALGVSARDNAVKLTKAVLTAGEEAAVATAIAGVSVSVLTEAAGTATLGHAQEADCGEYVQHLVCDTPLRGGVWTRAGSSTCTAGFYARGRSGEYTQGKHYVLTAAHCVYQKQNVEFGSHDLDGTYRKIGEAANLDEDGPRDVGIIGIDAMSPYLETNPPGTIFVDESNENGVVTTRNENYRIRATRPSPRSAENSVVCQSSSVRLPSSNNKHTQCGRIIDFQGAWGRFRGLARTEFCGVGGASGGPIYKNRWAYGLWSGSRRNGATCRWGMYQGVRAAEEFLEVDVVTHP